jgi:hypothetical protein
MLTGAPPFPDGTALQKLLNHGSQPPPDPRTWREDISDQLHDVLLRLMAKRPSQRYQKPIELVNDLVLLAESEGLARAQSPGAFMFTPTVVQRSLLEANLPWMVALAFLMGSTLWLQSMQATSGISQLPRITSVASSKSAPASAGRETAAKPDAPDVDRAKESPATGDVGDEDSAAKVTQVAPAALPDEVLVVAAQQPADVAPMQWERSLDEALLRAASESVVREIEIRGNAQLTQPIVLADRSVVIRGVLRQGVKASELRIDLGRTTQANPCLIELQGSSLRFDSMQVVVEMGGVVGRSGVIRMTGQESRTAVTNCEVNALESGATNGNRFIAPAFSLVHVGGSPAPTFGPFFPSFSSSESFSPNVQSSRQPSDGAAGLPYGPAGMAPLGGGANSTSGIRRGAGYGPTEFNGDIKGGLATDSRRRVEVSNSVLRLHGGLIALDDTQRKEKLELVVRQSLVVSSREVLFAKATNGEGNPRFVRAELALSTFISPAGFATFTYEGGGNPQLGLNRQSDSCAFWSAAGIGHLTLVGARRESLLGNFVLLDFQGQRNAYDRAIEEICQSNPGAPQSAKFGFQEAGTDGWFAERGSEFEVAWPLDLGSINFSSPSEISAIDRQTVVIKDDMFQPGVNAVGQ